MDKQNQPRCSCGQIISSRKMRDFYVHILECHPDAVIIGVPCRFCQKLIPFGLAACHQFMEHDLKPPFGGDFRKEMGNDYKVLARIGESKLKIVEPKR